MTAIPLIIEPDPTEPGAAEIYVEGQLGTRTYRFLLDTGAARSGVITDDYTRTFASATQHTSSGVFAAHSHTDLITIPAGITLGPITQQPFTLTRTPADTPGTPTLIGMDLLQAHCCHFRFDTGQLIVDEQPRPDVAWRALQLDAKAHPYVPVDFGPVQGSAVWDSGASLTVVDKGFIARHPAFFEPAGESTGTDATGTSVTTPMFTMAAVTLGGIAFPAQRVAEVDFGPVNATIELPMDLILGYPLLRLANWVFDFPRRAWAITQRLSA